MSEFSLKELGTIKCPKCNYENIGGVKYCAKCNTRLVELGKDACPRCGLKLDSSVTKCSNCGYDVKHKKILKLITTLIEMIIVVVLGFVTIKYVPDKYIWYYRVGLLIVLAFVLSITTKEYHKPIEYDEDEDFNIKNTELRKNKKRK